MVVVVTPVCLMRAGAFTIGLWANCCLPLSAEAGSGAVVRSEGPARLLPGLQLPHLPLGEGAVLLGACGVGEGVHGRAGIQRLPVGFPGMAVDDTCSVGHCNSQKCHGVLGTLHGPDTCSPARVGGAPGVSVPRGRSGDLWCFTQCLYRVLMVSRVFSPCDTWWSVFSLQ